MTLNVKDGAGASKNLSTYTDGSSEENPRHSIITAEGAGQTIGTIVDAAVTTNTTGTLSGKLRGIVSLLVNINGKTPILGTSAATSSIPVVLPTYAVDANNFTSVTTYLLANLAGALVGSAFGYAALQVTGTFVGTVKLQASMDGGTTWQDTLLHNGTSIVTNITAPGIFYCNLGGYSQFRFNCTAYTSGTISCIIEASPTASTVPILPLPPGTNLLGTVGASSLKSEATLTRPANTTTYAADDAVTDTGGAILTFSSIARANGLGATISNAVMHYSSYIAAPGYFELWLLDTTATPTTDNATFAPTDAVVATAVAIIPFNMISNGDKTGGGTGNMLYQSDGVPRKIKCATSDTALYGLVKTPNGFIPVANSETMLFRLFGTQD